MQKVALGSDWCVAPLNLLPGIYAAVTRHTLDGKTPAGWYPEQKISAAEAVQAYTWTSSSSPKILRPFRPSPSRESGSSAQSGGRAVYETDETNAGRQP